jgi:hypothetical protein
VSGTVLDAAGAPCAETHVRIQARFDDGASQQLYARTDKSGRFAVESTLRAAPVTLHVSLKEREGTWTSAPLTPLPDEELLLGDIVIGQ